MRSSWGVASFEACGEGMTGSGGRLVVKVCDFGSFESVVPVHFEWPFEVKDDIILLRND